MSSSTKPVGYSDIERADTILRGPRASRVVPLPEPVDCGWVGWRSAEEWEWSLITSARQRERRAELAMFAGLIS